MSESITVPPLMSLEGRAEMAVAEMGRVEHVGKPEERRAHVKAHFLAHLRAAVAYVRETNP